MFPDLVGAPECDWTGSESGKTAKICQLRGQWFTAHLDSPKNPLNFDWFDFSFFRLDTSDPKSSYSITDLVL